MTTGCAPVRARRAGSYQVTRSYASPVARERRSPAGSRGARIKSGAMKIAVCVKQVPDATVHKRIDPATKRLDRSGEAALNPTDLNAVEEALKIKESQGEGEVVLVSLGPEKAVDSLRKALAMGADRAVLVADAAAAGSDLVGTSRALAAALERERPTSSSSARPRATATARCCGPRSRIACAARSSRRSRRSPSRATRSRASARRSTATTSSPRRCPRSSPSRTRSTSPATPPSRGSWARRRSRRRRSRSPTSGSTRSVGEPGAKTTVLDLGPPPSRGDQVKIEDDGSAAQKILDYLNERRLL